MLKPFLIICLITNILFAGDYFIHLTENGIANKPYLLKKELKNIPGLTGSTFGQAGNVKFQDISPLKTKSNQLNAWLVLHSQTTDVQDLQSLTSNSLIDFYEPIGQFKIDFESNDSFSSKQWYLDKIKVQQAWAITKGSPNVIVGIIDTGIDFLHPDLQSAIWVNTAEDLNHNGMLDEMDINHIDDDGNGYIDDVVGWDFTDAPRFVDAGDYLNEDNEPWDEFGSGHGTQCAGIIAAQDNNGIGITGIAPGIKIMNLRAGTANGYLEEDDVGRAILYAVQNGAKIVNMSFGDKALSRFLRDVISYASEQGVIFVASAGNEGSSEPHFPSALPQVISVGASTQNDGIAGFSNYGNSIDLVAPGVDIFSTAVGSKYDSVNGTSFSAPIVSAVAGLILSEDSDISPDQLRNILVTSADDIYYTGWDSLSAAGRVSAYNAIRVPAAGILKINSPAANSSTASTNIAIIGSAAHPDLISTEISYGIGKTPEEWTGIATYTGKQIMDDTLAAFTAAQDDEYYTIRITMNLFNGRRDELHHTFHVDNSPPEITDVQMTDMWDGPFLSKLITFETDDICTANLYIRPQNSTQPYTTIVSPYETNTHRFKLDKKGFDGQFEFYIKVTNNSGLVTKDPKLYYFSMDKEIDWTSFNKVPWTLPSGYMLDIVTDLDHDGNDEIVMSRYDENSGFGPIEIYEYNNGQFVLKMLTGFTAIPRAAGDVDKDGKSDLLLGFGQHSYLFEANSPDSFPTKLVWQDTVNFWAAAYSDEDNDGKMEITGRIDDDYVVLENTGDNAFSEIARLTNPTSGENRLGVPKVELADIDNDGLAELIFGDYDGDLVAYQSLADNSITFLASGKTAHGTALELMSSDNSGIIFTATHTSDDLNYEHEFDARYWSIESIRRNNNSLISQDTLNIFGFADSRDFDSGLEYFDFDGHSYLYASFFPDLYIFEKKDNNWEPIWYSDEARSNTILVHDFDKDGNDEFYFNNGANIIGYTSNVGERPITPYAFRSRPLDSITVILDWEKVQNILRYNIYRGSAFNNLEYYASTSTNNSTDTVSIDKKYYYAVTSIDSSLSIPESYFSNVDSVQTAWPPVFSGYEISGDRQIIIEFDRSLWLDTNYPATVFRTSLGDFASSVVIINQTGLLISFTNPFTSGMSDTLLIDNVFGKSGVPISSNSKKIIFQFPDQNRTPYVKSTHWVSSRQIMIEFSEEMDFKHSPGYFSVTPSGGTKSISIFDSSNTRIVMDFDDNTFIGATGQASYLLLSGLKSRQGIEIDPETRISLNRETIGLANVIIYPQPVKPQQNELIFANLPGDVKITIYSLNGRVIRSLSEQTEYGGVHWNLKDDSGNGVASGVYLYDLHWKNKSEQGKIVIIR